VLYTALLGLIVQVNVTDSFESRWRYLQSQSANDTGRDAMAMSLQQLIADFPDDKRRADVMLWLSSLYEGLDPATGITNEPATVIRWLREAVDAAPPYSRLWAESVSRLAGRLRNSSPGEAEHLLTEVVNNCDEPVVRAMATHDLQMMAIWRGDYGRAEEFCRQLHKWYSVPENKPTSATDKAEIDGYIRSSASAMISAWSSSGNDNDKSKFLREMGGYQHIQLIDDGIRKFREAVGAGNGNSLTNDSGRDSKLRWLLIGINLPIVVGLGTYFLFKKARNLHA
jgi:hypothetical protein